MDEAGVSISDVLGLFPCFSQLSSLFLPTQVGHFLLRVGLFGRAEQNPSAKTSLITCVGAKSN